MRPTRRYWAVAGLTVMVVAAGLLFEQPALLVGAAALGGWLVATPVAFLLSVTRVDDRLDLAVDVGSTHAFVDGTVAVTLASGPLATDADVTARLRLPPGLTTAASGDDRTVRIDGDERAEATVSVSPPVAGTFTLPRPAVEVSDSRGLFTQRIARGPTPRVTVEPRQPRDAAVGGGDREYVSIGSNRATDRRGEGIEPAEIRKYVPGETVSRIDWNATARLPETYVREFETEAAVRTLFVIDARGSTRTGPDGETAFDYLREVALAMTAFAQAREDPAGLAVVDDDGLAFLQHPTSSPGGYDRLTRRLYGIEARDGRGRPPRRPGTGISLARRLASVDGSSPFLERLSAGVDHHRPLPADRSPLRSAVEAVGSGDDVRTVVLTDDTDRRELRETVEVARGQTHSTLVFLAPTVLYEPGSLADLPRAYDRYRAFERFRADLDTLAGVDALEVGPRDRIASVRRAGRPETA